MEQSAMRTLVRSERRLETSNSEVDGIVMGGNSAFQITSPFDKFDSLAHFMVKSLSKSLYSSMLKEITFSIRKIEEYGQSVAGLLWVVGGRGAAIKKFRQFLRSTLAKSKEERLEGELGMVFGVLKQRNIFTQKYCSGLLSFFDFMFQVFHFNFCLAFPNYQFMELCKRVRFEAARPLQTIIEEKSHGTMAYLILRGGCRSFVKSPDGSGENLIEEVSIFISFDF